MNLLFLTELLGSAIFITSTEPNGSQYKGGIIMKTGEKVYITANELAEMLGISVGLAYKLIRELNQELSTKGYIVIAGKCPRRYIVEKYYGFGV